MKRNKRRGNPPATDGMKAASASECTGLLPAQIETEAEAESVADLQDVPPVKPPFPGKR